MATGTEEAESLVSRAVEDSTTANWAVAEHQVTHFHVTGFSKFHQVAINPTELLMNALPQYLRSRPPHPNCVLISSQTLKVATETSRIELDRLYNRISDARTCERSAPAFRTVVLHFGVSVNATKFALELQAYNEATFRCPDELGWAPFRQRIDKSKEQLKAIKQTSLPLDVLVTDLLQEGFDVRISNDAGRFVCNWVYYYSLSRAMKCGAVSLFVHVPPESAVSIPEQLKFTRALMQSISRLPSI